MIQRYVYFFNIQEKTNILLEKINKGVFTLSQAADLQSHFPLLSAPDKYLELHGLNLLVIYPLR